MSERETFIMAPQMHYHHANRTHQSLAVCLTYDLKRYHRRGFRGTNEIKRLIDVTVAALTIILFSPLFLFIALLIKITSNGPVLFWQTRVGLRGRRFQLPKFRSMVVDAEKLKGELLKKSHHGESVTFKMKSDPRVTRFGRVIRKMSLDEFPQLWCVLKGEMSLVGPRPPLPCEVINYRVEDRRRLSVKPGLTCIWQVSGRGNIPFHKQVALDMQYIESQSLRLDIILLLRTIPAVLSGSGAY